MKLIVGLGNPGEKYQNNRHNIGYKVIDAISKEYDIRLLGKKLPLLYSKFRIEDKAVIIAKPLVYMNASGEAVQAIANYYKIETHNIIVLLDDFAIDFGKIRIRAKGSDGGHNGLKSIIKLLGTDNFIRVRIGIGQQDRLSYDSNYVLGDFSKSEKKQLTTIINKTLDCIKTLVLDSVEKSMNLFN